MNIEAKITTSGKYGYAGQPHIENEESPYVSEKSETPAQNEENKREDIDQIKLAWCDDSGLANSHFQGKSAIDSPDEI